MTSNSTEALTLLADQLQAILDKTVGPEVTYVLVIASQDHCNCISNAPVEKAHQIKDIFRQLANRNVQLQS